MGAARKSIGSMIATLQLVDETLGSIEANAKVLKGCRKQLETDQKALQKIGFTGLPPTFDAALQEQVGFLSLAGESMAAALDVSYSPELAAACAAAKRTQPNKRTIEKAKEVGVALEAWLPLSHKEKIRITNARAKGLTGEELIAGTSLPITALLDHSEVEPVALHVVDEEIEEGALAA